MDRLRGWVNVLCYLAVPVFTVLAYRGWAKTVRLELPRWRSTIGLASMMVVSADWLFVILLLALRVINDSWTNFFGDTWANCLTLAALAAALLAISLKGATRLQGVLAGLLMTAFWMTSFVE